VKTQFRALANGPTAGGVTVLDTEATMSPSGVFVGGYVYEEGASRLVRINCSGARGSGPLATKTLPFSHLTDEVSLRMVVTGMKVALTAWPVDQPEPAPQLIATLPRSFSSQMGHVAAFAGNRTTSVPIAFRYIEVSAVPEPTTSILLGVACAALAARRRRGTPWRGGSARFAALAAAMLAVGNAGQAATIFYDDFEDGSATDGSPVTWTPRVYTNGSFQVDAGSYTLTPGVVGEAVVSVVDGLTAANVSIRSQVRTSGNVDGIGLFARFEEGAFTYQGGIDAAGDVYIGWNGPDTRYTNLGNVLTALRPTLYDVSLQFDVFGDDLRMYAWRSGEAMPAQPTVHVLSSLRSEPGQVGVLNDPRSSAVVAFRYVHVADAPIPEPSTLGLLGLAATACLRGSRRRRMGTAT
jgi:hypothetical protein